MNNSLKERIKEISELIGTQDNRSTAHPIFAVEQLKRDYGYSSDFSEDYVWFNNYECEDISEEEDIEKLENHEFWFSGVEETEEDWQKIEDWIKDERIEKCYYIERWEFVTACFTEEGCKDYLRANGHNLNETRIYAYGSYRNEEWQTLRSFLKDNVS